MSLLTTGVDQQRVSIFAFPSTPLVLSSTTPLCKDLLGGAVVVSTVKHAVELRETERIRLSDC